MNKRIIKAWIKKKLKIQSPACHYMGYKYEYDMLKDLYKCGDKKEV